jgi:hypothetical protein
MSDMKRLEDKIDKLDNHLGNIDVTLAEQHAQLTLHIEQTNILREEVKPIRNSHQQILGVIKFLSFLSGLGALFLALSKIR